MRWMRTAALMKRAMEDEDLSSAQVAERIEVSPSFIDSILRGAKRVPARAAKILAGYSQSSTSFNDYLQAYLEDSERHYRAAAKQGSK